MPQNGPIRTSVLPSGLVVITERLPHIRSVALGLAFKLGGRDDPAGSEGTAHLIEHMVFKGTPDLSARAISTRAESLGAELNAFTGKELTCFYGRFPGDQQVPVTSLLAEIVTRPAFAEAELAKEKEVVAEEIRSTDEDPDSKASNLMLAALYPEQPMGAPVVGSLDSVSRMKAGGLRSLYRERYNSGTGVAIAVGDVMHEELCQALAEKTSTWQPGSAPGRKPAVCSEPHVLAETRQELSQVYMCLARPAFPYPDPRRYALSILNTAFGGGISSRLFQRLREDEGLVYSVSSFVELHGDSGILGVYFVADRKKLERCVTVLEQEISLLRRDRLSREEFERARNMTKSSVLLGLESSTSRMVRLAQTHHMLGRLVTVDETLAAYNRLKLDEVNELVDELLDTGGYHVGAVGPIDSEELKKVTGLLNG